MKLQLATWPDIEDYLKRSTTILIPVGSTEQHGPNGFIGTDALCPEIFADGLSKEYDVLVAPTFSVGMAQHHLGFPGSITLRPSTMIAVVLDWLNSLAKHGFTRFYFLNGHGGNIATLTAAFSELYAQSSLNLPGSNRPGLQCKLRNWWEAPGLKRLSGELFGADEGSHATCSEVSLTWYAYPEQAKTGIKFDERASTGPIFDSADFRRRYPDGRMGSNPGRASVEAGRRIYETGLPGLAEDFRSFAATGDDSDGD